MKIKNILCDNSRKKRIIVIFLLLLLMPTLFLSVNNNQDEFSKLTLDEKKELASKIYEQIITADKAIEPQNIEKIRDLHVSLIDEDKKLKKLIKNLKLFLKEYKTNRVKFEKEVSSLNKTWR